MWVMLPVILSSPGIVRDFERLSDKALKPSLAGEYPGCKMVFSNSFLNFSCLIVSAHFQLCPYVHGSFFLVWICQHHLWHFLSFCFLYFFSKQTKTSGIQAVDPARLQTKSYIYIKSLISMVPFDDTWRHDFQLILQNFWATWGSYL